MDCLVILDVNWKNTLKNHDYHMVCYKFKFTFIILINILFMWSSVICLICIRIYHINFTKIWYFSTDLKTKGLFIFISNKLYTVNCFIVNLILWKKLRVIQKLALLLNNNNKKLYLHARWTAVLNIKTSKDLNVLHFIIMSIVNKIFLN